MNARLKRLEFALFMERNYTRRAHLERTLEIIEFMLFVLYGRKLRPRFTQVINGQRWEIVEGAEFEELAGSWGNHGRAGAEGSWVGRGTTPDTGSSLGARGAPGTPAGTKETGRGRSCAGPCCMRVAKEEELAKWSEDVKRDTRS